MSIDVNLRTPQKKSLANVLRSIAEMIETSNNATITVQLNVTFNNPEKASK